MFLCRVLPHESADGPRNMATDEALLDSVAANPRAAIVRTYAWSTPTLSLGYFQSHAAVAADPRWQGHAIVRRATGGGALSGTTARSPMPWSFRPSTRSPDQAPRSTGRSTAPSPTSSARSGPRRTGAGIVRNPRTPRPLGRFSAFRIAMPTMWFSGVVKLVGSAQRRRAGAVLQHGSLLLARSPTTPELPGLADLIDAEAVDAAMISHWRDVLGDVLPRVVGSQVSDEDFTNQEQDRADILRREIYATPEWTRRR